MNLSEQVCSLEYAKRLQELGVKQDSLFYWYNKNEDKSLYGIAYTKGSKLKDADIYSAFNVAELGEMLPDWSESCKRAYDDWFCLVREKNSEMNHHAFSNKEADARANMIIFLIENGSMKVDK